MKLHKEKLKSRRNRCGSEKKINVYKRRKRVTKKRNASERRKSKRSESRGWGKHTDVRINAIKCDYREIRGNVGRQMGQISRLNS